jgi:hypothetical protein
MNTRAFTAEESAHLDRFRGLVNEIDTHHRAACDAHDAGDDKALGREHVALRRCIRSAQVVFTKMADAAVSQDIKNSQQAQTSSGTTPGTSSPPRATPGLMQGDAETWLKLSNRRQPARGHV